MPRTKALIEIVLTMTLIGASACSSDDDDDSTGSGNSLSATTAASLEGLYQIASHLEDAAGCGTGTEVAGGPGYFVAVALEAFGIQTLTLVSCVEETECAEYASSIRSMGAYGGYDFSYTLSEETSPVALSGLSASTGFSNGAGMCTERTYTDIVLAADGAGGVRLDVTVKGLSDRAQEDEYCVVEPAESRKEAANAPCVGHTSIQATRIADI